MARSSGSRPAQSSSPPAKKPRGTVEARAQQKLRENFGALSEEEREGFVHPDTKRTLRQQLEADIRRNDECPGCVAFGKWYMDNLKTMYRQDGSVHLQLAPPEGDASVVAPKLLEVQKLLMCAI